MISPIHHLYIRWSSGWTCFITAPTSKLRTKSANKTPHTTSPNPVFTFYHPSFKMKGGKSFHQNLAHVEAIISTMSRTCQKLWAFLYLWTIHLIWTQQITEPWIIKPACVLINPSLPGRLGVVLSVRFGIFPGEIRTNALWNSNKTC